MTAAAPMNGHPKFARGRRWLGAIAAIVAAVLIAAGCGSARAPDPPPRAFAADEQLPGVRDDGRVQLPNQWSLQPAGRQLELGDFPVNIAVHPGGRYAAVLHAGYGQHEVMVLELMGKRAVLRSRAPLEAAFYGLAWSAAGDRLFCSGGPRERIEAFAFIDG